MSEPISSPASSGLVERAKNILLKPGTTWDVIATEPSSIKSIYMGYVVPLAAIGPVAMAIGYSVFGFGIPGLFSYRTPIQWALSGAIVQYVLSLVMVYVMALVIDGLAPNFGGEKNQLQAFKVSAYSCTAAWLAGIFAIFPTLGMLGVLGLYSLYLLYVGLPKLMKAPAEKAVGYTAVTVIVMIVLWIVVGMLTGPIYRLGAPGLGLASGNASGAAVGTVTVPGMGSVDVNKMQRASEQMAAQASAMQNGQTNVKTADPNALLALLPQAYMGATRSETSASSDATGGVAVSNARATYAVGTGTLRVKISDMGSMAGLGAMAQAMNVNHTETTATGYEKITSQNGSTVSEKYDTQSKSGSYSVLAGGRIALEVEGDGVDMATMKALAGAIDLGKAESLTK